LHCKLSDLTDWAGLRADEVAPILETLCASRILRGVATPGPNRPSDASYEVYHDVLAPAILDWRRGYLQAQERAEADRRAAEQAQAEAKGTYANRLRNLYAMAGGFAVIAIVFLGLWVYQLRHQGAELGRQAHARELADFVRNIIEPNPPLGTLLAIEAVRATSLVDGSMTDAAADVLQHIVHAPHAEKQLLGLSGTPRTIFFSPDGTRLVATGRQRTVGPGPATMIWDETSGSRVPPWRPITKTWDPAGLPVPTMIDEKTVSALAISRDGQWFATADSDGGLRVLEAASGKERFTVIHDSIVNAAVFSPDGQRLATASIYGNVKISVVNSGKELFTLEGQGNKIAVPVLAFSSNAKWLAVAKQDETVTVLDVDTGTEAFRKSVPGQSVVTTLTFNANGNRLVATLSLGPEQNITVWEVPSGKSSSLRGHYDVDVISPDGKLLASAGPDDSSVHVWDITSPENIKPWRTLVGHARRVLDVAFSPDSSRIASADAEGTRIWNVFSGRELLFLKASGKVAFSPDGTTVAIGSQDGTVSVWNLGFHGAKVLKVVFTADGERLATSGDDGTVKIWNANTRRFRGTLGPSLGKIFGLAFSEDGSQLVTANNQGQVTVWDLGSFQPIFPPFETGLKGAVELAWSDGKSLVTAGEGGGAKVWDATNGGSLGAFGRQGPAQGVALSGNGHLLVTGSPEGETSEIRVEWMNGASWIIPGKDLFFRDVALSPTASTLRASVRRA